MIQARQEYPDPGAIAAPSPHRERPAARRSAPAARGPVGDRGYRAPRARPDQTGRKAVHRQGRSARARLTRLQSDVPVRFSPTSTGFVPGFAANTMGTAHHVRREIEQVTAAALAADNSTRYIAANGGTRAHRLFHRGVLRNDGHGRHAAAAHEAGGRLWQEFIAHGIQRGDKNCGARTAPCFACVTGLRECRARRAHLAADPAENVEGQGQV